MRQPLLLGTLAASNIGIAFLYQWYVLIQIGPGSATDALFAGMTVPQLVLTVVSSSLTHVLVPLLGGESPQRSRHDAWSFFVLVGACFGALALVLHLAAPYWVPLIVPGFSEAGKALTVDLTRIQLFGMVFTALSGVQTAVYHAQQRFVWVEVGPLMTGVLGLVALFFLLPRFGIEGVAWITALRAVVQTALQMPGMGRWSRPDLRSKSVVDAWRRIKPLLLGTTYYKTDPLIDRVLLSMTTSGNLSLYYLGQQIYGAGSAVVTKAVVAPLVPRLSVRHKGRDSAGFRRLCRRALWETGVVAAGSFVVVALFGQSLLSLLVGHGAVTQANVATLWLIMFALGGTLVGGIMGSVTSSSFYARGETRLPTRLSMMTYTIYVPIKVASFLFGGVLALAISASVFYLAILAIQWFYLEKS